MRKPQYRLETELPTVDLSHRLVNSAAFCSQTLDSELMSPKINITLIYIYIDCKRKGPIEVNFVAGGCLLRHVIQ